MFNEAVEYPWDNGDGLKPLVIGTILSFLSFLIIPTIFIAGYFVRVLEATLNDNPTPPEWEDYTELLVDGLKSTVITFVYGAILAALLIGAMALVASGVLSGNSPITVALGVILGLVALVLLLVLSFLIPAALANMLDKQSFFAAFNVPDVADIILTQSYSNSCTTAFLILLVTAVLAAVTGPTVIGPPLVTYYGVVASARAYGLGARPALE